MEMSINKIVLNKRAMLAAASMVLIVFLWYKFLFLDQQADLERLRGEIEKVEADVSGWMVETKNLSDYQNEYQALRENHSRFLFAIPETNEVQELAEQIIGMGKNHGCRVAYVGVPVSRFFDDKVTGEPGEVMIIPLMLIIKGNFIPVGEFMESLSRLSFFASFGELEMSRSSRIGIEELETNLWLKIYVKRDTLKG
jgi:Tfp pilus assembly protein PilO